MPLGVKRNDLVRSKGRWALRPAISVAPISRLGVRLRMWHDSSMPTTLQPSELRPLLHEKIDQCAPDDLPLLHRVMVELERDRLVAGLNAEFDRDREAGRLARLPEIIREARAALATRRPDSV